MNDNTLSNALQETDSLVYDAINAEFSRQQSCIELIASENIVSKAVLEAQGSIMTNKYAEGYPGKRYYGGCSFVDICENLAIERLKELFNVKYANVQPHSGSQANQAVFMALLNPGDKILGMSLDAGGHLTHGSKVNQSGKWFNSTFYGVDKISGLLDYDEIEKIAKKEKPKMIIAGCSAYPRFINFEKFRKIADSVGAYLMADMAHFAGIVAASIYPHSPTEHADIVTSTTHKTLRGPRGGIILTNSAEIAKKINSAVFPGLQGGPLMHVIAAKAVAFAEALNDEYKIYITNVLKNAKVMCEVFIKRGYKVLTDGTDSHLLILNFSDLNLNGKIAQNILEDAGITCNKNAIPFDKESPFVTSGIRIGSPACTTRGMKEKEFKEIAHTICDILDIQEKALIDGVQIKKSDLEPASNAMKNLVAKFPIYDSAI